MEGFYRVAAAVPKIRVADVGYNVEQTTELIARAAQEQCALVAFPELGLTGYTCADLFLQVQLQDRVLMALDEVRAATEDLDTVAVVGAPLRQGNRLYNCAVVIHDGAFLGVVPKSFLPTYKEFYERRWFAPGGDVRNASIDLESATVPFGTDLLFVGDSYFVFGVELCEDLWAVIPPSCYQVLAGATVTVNLSASDELVAKADYRRQLVASQSARCVSGYLYCGAGVGESTTDVVYGGHALIAENGVVLEETPRFQRDSALLTADLDCLRLSQTRLTETSFPAHAPVAARRLPVGRLPVLSQLRRTIDPPPFVPADAAGRDARCREIFNIQATGLAKRLEHTRSATAVVGVSGGLDSTLALLVAGEAMARLGRGPAAVVAVTMPGFGTSGRTHESAVTLCRQLGVTLREISIKPACLQHFKDIGHRPDQHDRTFENVQARERTQLLMDLANQENGLVIGTGDLSELALGWSTYNGDHMSMYAVNCGVPKTLVRYIIGWVADQREAVRDVLHRVLATPVTPELLPTDANGEIAQMTESVIGPYELHDFFLYHTVKYGASPARIRRLAELAFRQTHTAEAIEHWLTLFVQRFFSQQFKRSCLPDGPKVGSISLSPRGDWRMPSDASPEVWLKDVARGLNPE